MKNILAAFTFSLFLISCSDNSDIIPEEDPLAVTALTGKLQCADNSPLANVTITIEDSNGLTFSTTTDGSGSYSFDNILEDDYLMSFVDPSFFNYSEQQFDDVAADMEDIIYGVTGKTNLDHIAYNIVNYEDGITTLDLVLLNKLKSGDLSMNEVDFPWRYVKTSDINTNSAITNVIEFNYTSDLVFDVTAIFVGDVSGLACQ